MPARGAAEARGASVRAGTRGSSARRVSRAFAGGMPTAQLVEIQRSRLLSAAVKAVEELGYTDATVARITARARVSRRTFYELFANREECLLAMLEEIVALVEGELEAADAAQLPWRERLRTSLEVILAFLDREPVLARVCVVQSARGGPAVLRRREEILAALTAVVDEGRRGGARGSGCTRLTAEGLVGAAYAIVYARLMRGERKPLIGLLGELMGMLVLPYQGRSVARREQTRPAPGPPLRAQRGSAGPSRTAEDPLDGVTMRLTYRTARVLEGVAEHPGASNREVADNAGIADQGQVSKLLARLQRLGLLANSGDRASKGEPNAWTLTARGERVTQSIRLHAQVEQGTA